MFIEYFALTIMIVVFLILVYAAIYIHTFPMKWPGNAIIPTRMPFMWVAG